MCVFSVTACYVSEERAPEVVKSPPAQGALRGKGMQPGGWPTLQQLWRGSAVGYKSMDLTAEGAGLRLLSVNYGHNRLLVSRRGVCSGRIVITYSLPHSCMFTQGTKDCWNLFKWNNLRKHLRVWRWCFVGGVLGRTLTMPPSVMKNTEMQYKVPCSVSALFLAETS